MHINFSIILLLVYPCSCRIEKRKLRSKAARRGQFPRTSRRACADLRRERRCLSCTVYACSKPVTPLFYLRWGFCLSSSSRLLAAWLRIRCVSLKPTVVRSSVIIIMCFSQHANNIRNAAVMRVASVAKVSVSVSLIISVLGDLQLTVKDLMVKWNRNYVRFWKHCILTSFRARSSLLHVFK